MIQVVEQLTVHVEASQLTTAQPTHEIFGLGAIKTQKA
jgi:hypothetical protein